MKIEGDTITFKSTPDNYYNEFHGFKCNTVRRIKIPEEVKAFREFRRHLTVNSKVQIIETVPGDFKFIRTITNITRFEGCAGDDAGIWIISWRA